MPSNDLSDADRYRAAYDRQLRTEAETNGADSIARVGPLWCAVFPGGQGFITYADLGGVGQGDLARLAGEALMLLQRDGSVDRVEWKTRGHDHAPGLHEALLQNGFRPGDPESVMIGEADRLAADVRLPDGVALRRVSVEADVMAMEEMHGEVFGDSDWRRRAATTLDRLTRDDSVEVWVAEAAGLVISAGRLEPVAGTDFAGLWGGATRPEWRHRGIYRALTARRARSALEHGKRLLHSDSTDASRPILERAGMVKVSTTTPYEWRRGQRQPA